MHELVIDWCQRIFKGPALGNPRLDLIRILDAGCGTGGLTNKLETFGKVVGLDISPLALSFAQKQKLSLVNGSVNFLPFSDEIFNLVVSTSVLYHRLVDEEKAISEFYRVVSSGGKIILILPAFSLAYSRHDEAVHTRRRYTLAEAVGLVEPFGFRAVEARYIYSLLFPTFIVKRLWEKLFLLPGNVSDLETLPRWLNHLMLWWCRIEWSLGRFIRLPFGSSILIVAIKKKLK